MHKSTILMLLGMALLALAGCRAAPKPTAYPTYTPYPAPTPYPTYTPYPAPIFDDVTDLFCGYDFCIGHPASAWLTDVGAPDEWSEYDIGLLTGLNASGAYMDLDWVQVDEDEWNNEAEALDAANIYEAQGDVRSEQIGAFQVALVDTFDAEDEGLPYGIAAAWYCGDRGFRALIFHKRESRPEALMIDAITRFICDK